MGKIVQEKRWLIAVILLALAAILPVALTQYSVQRGVTYCDYREAIIKGPAQPVILQTGGSIADTFCREPTSATRTPIMAFRQTAGLFPRNEIPWTLAMFGGIALPLLFCGVALSLSLHSASSFIRRAVSVLMLLPGLTLFLLLGSMAMAAFEYGFWAARLLNSEALCMALLGTALTGTGIWLWRAPSRKEPA